MYSILASYLDSVDVEKVLVQYNKLPHGGNKWLPCKPSFYFDKPASVKIKGFI